MNEGLLCRIATNIIAPSLFAGTELYAFLHLKDQSRS